MGLFGKILGSAKLPSGPPAAAPPPPPPPSSKGASKRFFGSGDDLGRPLEQSGAENGPFPKRMRLRANLEEYNLVSSWQDVTLNGAADLETARAHVIAAYYKQYGLYRLPDGNDTIRWNETTWREIQGSLRILYHPGFLG